MSNPQYCVTGRNRLTGEREVLTPGLSIEKARDVKATHSLDRRSSKRPYTHLKIELYPPETANNKL